MRNRIIGLLALATGSLIACRALVGIEDYPVADSDKDSGADAESVDAGFDAIAAKNAECRKTDCRKCCKDAYEELRALDKASETRKCLCEASRCGGNAACSGDGGYCSGGAPSTDCVPCVDDKFKQNTCTRDCTSPGCLAGLSCLQGCPNP